MADMLATFVLRLYDFPPFGLRGQWHFSRPDTQAKVGLKQCRLTNLCEFSRKCPKHKVCEDLASLGGGFKYFLFSSLPGGKDPI